MNKKNIKDNKTDLNESKRNQIWNKHFNDLHCFITTYKKLPSANNRIISDEYKLYTWLLSQKKLYTNNLLSKNKFKLLDDILCKVMKSGAWTKPGNLNYEGNMIARWNQYYSEILEFVKINHRLPDYKATSKPEISYFAWCQTMRFKYNHKRLSTDQEKKIAALFLLVGKKLKDLKQK
jgi:hypothetical protein